MKIIAYYTRILLGMALVSMASQTAWAQDKMEPSIELTYFKNADQVKVANVSVSAMDSNGKLISANNAHVSFYLVSDTSLLLVKEVFTNSQGKASVDLPEELPLDDERYFGIVAQITDDEKFADAEEEIWYMEASLALKLQTEDSTKTAIAKLTEMDGEGQEIPLADIDVNFYVKRLFGVMPAAEEYTVTTDEEGVATFQYPNDIPGDFEGNITVMARIDDNEDYGNIASQASEKWGVVLAPEKNPFPRALWAPDAPPAMIITLSLIFGGIWFTFGFVAYQLKRINKSTI